MFAIVSFVNLLFRGVLRCFSSVVDWFTLLFAFFVSVYVCACLLLEGHYEINTEFRKW